MVSQAKAVRFCEAKESTTLTIERSCSSLATTLWYTSNDFETFKTDERTRVSQFIDRADTKPCGGAKEQQVWCLRGLEKFAQSSRTASHVRAILDLQKEHRSTGMNDPKGVAMLSKTLSKSDRRLASLFGSVDHKEVSRIWREEGETGTLEAVGSEYYQLSMAVLDQSPDAPILLNEGMRYSPRRDTRKRIGRENERDIPTADNESGCFPQLCLVRRRHGDPSPKRSSSRAA